MNVKDLMQLLETMPPDMKVVRADIEAGAIPLTEVEVGDFYSHGAGENRYWPNYFPEIARDPDETPNERLVVLR